MTVRRTMAGALPLVYGAMTLCATLVRADNCSGPSDCQAAPANIDWTTALGISGVLMLIGWRLFTPRRPGPDGRARAVHRPGSPRPAAVAHAPHAVGAGDPAGAALTEPPREHGGYAPGGYAVHPPVHSGEQLADQFGAIVTHTQTAGAPPAMPPAHAGHGAPPPGIPPTVVQVASTAVGATVDPRADEQHAPTTPGRQAAETINQQAQQGGVHADTAHGAHQDTAPPGRSHEGLPSAASAPPAHENHSAGPPGLPAHEVPGIAPPSDVAHPDFQAAHVGSSASPPGGVPFGVAPLVAPNDARTTITFSYNDAGVAPDVPWTPGTPYRVAPGTVAFVLWNYGTTTHAFALTDQDNRARADDHVGSGATAVVRVDLARGTYRLHFDVPSWGYDALLVD